MAEIRMPKMGDTMEEGTILRWLKREGDQVAADEPIAEIETDKANVEMTAEEAGTLTKIVVPEGQTVPVGAVIAQIGVAGEGAAKEAPAAAEPAREARPPAQESSRPAQQERTAAGPAAERVKASPLARKKARQLGIDLALIQGSGPGGRIVERDVAAFHERHGAGLPAAPAMPPGPPEPAAPARVPVTAAPTLEGQDYDLSRMRRAIARITTQSKQTIPHFYLVMPVEMESALGLLESMNAGAGEARITINDLVVKASAVALAKFPDVNVSFTPEEKVRRYQAINIGVAVGTNEGLTIPVIMDCGSRTLRQISAEARALIAKARGGTLSPQEMSGATFTVSNLGMFGVEEFAAIISPPQSAILAVGAVLPEAVPGRDGGVEVRRRMRVTLSCDHRTVDGLLGARFLQEVRRLLESPYELVS